MWSVEERWPPEAVQSGWPIRVVSGRTHRAFWRGLAQDPAFRRSWSDLVRQTRAPGVFWECAPVSHATLDHPFECVLLPSRAFAGLQADPHAFAEHLAGDGPDIRVFANLSGRSTLISPVGPGDFAHLLAFLCAAPASQVDALWRVTGQTVLDALDSADRPADAPLWVSTHGLGVYWLHVRLDPRPKYIHHRPYHRWPI
jgi:hypothetical protein